MENLHAGVQLDDIVLALELLTPPPRTRRGTAPGTQGGTRKNWGLADTSPTFNALRDRGHRAYNERRDAVMCLSWPKLIAVGVDTGKVEDPCVITYENFSPRSFAARIRTRTAPRRSSSRNVPRTPKTPRFHGSQRRDPAVVGTAPFITENHELGWGCDERGCRIDTVYHETYYDLAVDTRQYR